MRMSWAKLVQYVGTSYGQDISNELQKKVTVTLVEPVHKTEVLTRHGVRKQMISTVQMNIAGTKSPRGYSVNGSDRRTGFGRTREAGSLTEQHCRGRFEANVYVPVELTDSEKTQFSNEWRTYRERNANLMKHRGQAFSLIQGQCTQLLQDKVKQDTDWNTVSTSYNPLTLYRLIEKTVLAQTEDRYPFATPYNQKLAVYMFKHEGLSDPQWYERFNTKIDVGDAIGVTCQHKVLLEYVAQELHIQAFANLSAAEQQTVRDVVEERYVFNAFLRQSGTQHGNIKVDLQNGTTGDNRYPKNRKHTLRLIDECSKTVVNKATPSEGTSFARGGGSDDKRNELKTFDEKSCFSVTRKDTLRRTARTQTRKTTRNRSRAQRVASVNSRRTSRTRRKHSPRSTLSLHS
jgi:hypothetical protein